MRAAVLGPRSDAFLGPTSLGSNAEGEIGYISMSQAFRFY